ncbi:hypothetical protein [Thiohalorhabdus sp.]|uniref:hypothetical protein n=1 Tax=Thiohalorhabdus sp. TaxID=3094134 RepID=UPI002FC3C373
MAKAITGALMLALGTAGLAHAGNDTPEFSAKVVQKAPNRADMTWRIHAGTVSGNQAIRSESERGGEKWAQVTFPEEGRQVLMNLTAKTYQERSLPEPPRQPAKAAKAESGDSGPCPDVPWVRCEKLDTETVHGRDAVKWRIMRFGKGQPARWLVWIDQERDFPVRRVGPDGTYMERRLAKEAAQVNGRQTEKWQTVISRSNGRSFQSVRWYDPELDMTIKEKREGGFVRELKNIEVGEQPDKLFQIPDKFSPAYKARGGNRPPAKRSPSDRT